MYYSFYRLACLREAKYKKEDFQFQIDISQPFQNKTTVVFSYSYLTRLIHATLNRNNDR